MKLFGIVLLSIIPILFCLRLGEELRLKWKRRKAFLELLRHVRFQIEIFSREQKEIFHSFENAVLEKTDFFEELLLQVDSNPYGALNLAWKNHGTLFSFNSDTNQLLDRLAEHFGLLEKNAQLGELSRAIEHLEKLEQKDKTEIENKIKILRISGLTAGLGILILLI